MRQEYIEVSGVEDGVNFDGRFQVKTAGGKLQGIAYYLLGWEAEQRPMICFGEDEEGEEVELEDWSETELVRASDCVVAVMVGDDHRWVVDKSDLVEISDEDYCGGCGQVGCQWG